MRRRDFLRGTALATTAAVPALPVLAGAEIDTPILRLYRAHQALTDDAEQYLIDHPEGDDEELEQLFYQQTGEIEAEMMATPSTCAADFAAKVIVDSVDGSLWSSWETGAMWKEARALTGTSLASDAGQAEEANNEPA